MKRFHLPTGVWVAGGLVCAALVMPAVSSATATLEQLVGTNGTTVANVTKDHQLETTLAPPSDYLDEWFYQPSGTGGCSGIIGAQPHKAFVVTGVTSVTDSSGELGDIIYLTTGNCTTNSYYAVIEGDRPDGTETDTPISPGEVIPAGTYLSYQARNPDGVMSTFIGVQGYWIPAAEAPAARAADLRKPPRMVPRLPGDGPQSPPT